MGTMSSKLSFYDFLNILVPGFLFVNLFLKSILQDCNWINISIASFIIGLVYHKSIECIGKWICNCKYIKKKVSKLVEKMPQWAICNYKYIRIKAYESVKNRIDENPMPDNKEKTYLQAYYMVAKSNCLMNIPILEAHIAFVRNIWFILICYSVAIGWGCPSVESLKTLISQYFSFIGIPILMILLSIILTILLIYIWYSLQSKVCELVWEGAYFISKIQKDEKNNLN